MNGKNRLLATDLRVEYPAASGPVRALDIAEFSVAGGASTAVMGPSGCGKSTLLGLLAGLALPTSGTVRIGETDLGALREAERIDFRRSCIGMVYQADNLLPFLTIAENIQLQLMLCQKVAGAERRTAELLDRLGLGGLGERLPDQLSGGQRQRAAIARAIVHEPAVILADEPTGALDDENAAAVVELLLEAQQHLGATLVVVTHDPQVARCMGELITLRAGAIATNLEPVDVS
ncbi:MAG: ATP-binding cassette domain-containing protein [Anaerolineales bacterium]|nr:ATP-binding cassette domain-containing protein [Anaerolineales bacterium]